MHELTQPEADGLTRRLQAEDVPVTVRVEGGQGGPRTVVLWPSLALTTAQQAHTLHVVCHETDSPVRWAGA
jgi:hypothetical protein